MRPRTRTMAAAATTASIFCNPVPRPGGCYSHASTLVAAYTLPPTSLLTAVQQTRLNTRLFSTLYPNGSMEAASFDSSEDENKLVRSEKALLLAPEHPPLLASKLRWTIDPSQFDFETTDDLPPLENGLLGQDRAQSAIEFGIHMKRDGYNVYVLGPPGMGKRTIVKKYLEEVSSRETDKAPSDYCYVHNFVDADKPKAIRLAAGLGRELKVEMEKLMEELQTAIPDALEEDAHKHKIQESTHEVFKDNERQVENLFDEAKASNLTIVKTQTGNFLIAGPEKKEDGNPMSPEEQKFANAAAEALKPRMEKLFNAVPKLRKEAIAKAKEISRERVRQCIDEFMGPLRTKYGEYEAVLNHFQAVEDDLVEHFERIRPDDEDNDSPLSLLNQPKKLSYEKYQINHFVDNSEKLDGQGVSHAPVIFEDHPTHTNLLGRIEYQSTMGSLMTSFSLIKPGSLHKANGGYLVLRARDLLRQPFAYESLKRALRLKKLQIESLGSEYSLISTTSLQPEPIDLDVKVILLGDRMLYYLMTRFDEEFDQLFKVAADFSDEIDRSDESIYLYAELLGSMTKSEDIRPLNREAVAACIEQAARSVEDQERLSTHLSSMTEVLFEADYYAETENESIIGKEHVLKALEQQIYRSDRIKKLIYEQIERGTLMVDITGEIVGQVNGLSVLNMGKIQFGRPSKITATTRLGRGRVVDVEREVDLGGAIHSKGVMILSSLLGHRYAEDCPLSVSASLAFEQSYGMVDGDSASMAELCAILSSLADVPIKQNLAITGSVNQHGQAQPIGGAIHKIEGFYDICQASGSSGQGVLIPDTNIPNLMLRPDIVEACEREDFAIYTYKDVDEALSLLTGVAAGERGGDGKYPEGTLNYKVDEKLHLMAEIHKNLSDDGDDTGLEKETKQKKLKP